ncbi:MAG TPA: hypothetical protein VGH19_01215 [Verrucomicrobiae bacterium]
MTNNLKTLVLALGLCGLVMFVSCTTETQPDTTPPATKDIEVVTYHDRNGDGKADLEKHSFPGWADRDWVLRDDDFDGRFEKKIVFGVAVWEHVVDFPVPTSIQLEKGTPAIF